MGQKATTPTDEEKEVAWAAITKKYPRPFSGICRPMKCPPLKIKLKPGTKPVQVYSARPIPIPLMPAFEREIESQLREDIIEPANDTNDPSEWVHPTVITRKNSPDQIRLTVDVRELNKATVRPIYPAKSPWHVVTNIPGSSKFFSVLDGRKGFHQVELHPESQKLTTFVTPIGRFRYKRLIMGWCGASDVFNEKMAEALAKVKNISRVVEDVLVHTETWGEHKEAVRNLIAACDEHDISINTSKIQFGQTEVRFGGFVVSEGKYQIDPSLTDDLRNFPRPQDRSELKSFLGLAQQLGNFTPEIATLTEPLRNLNSTKQAWIWMDFHNEAFEKAQDLLSSPRFLTYFDPARETELLTDASRIKGLGFLLRQRCKEDNEWRTVQCGSRMLAKHESNWSGMAELEALAVVWAAKKC